MNTTACCRGKLRHRPGASASQDDPRRVEAVTQPRGRSALAYHRARFKDLPMVNSFLARAFAAAILALGLAGTSVAQQAVRVASTPTGIPFTFLDTKTNQISGIMVDLMKAIGKDQGFAIEITPMTFSTLIAALQANKVDVIAAAMYITPTRQEVVDFSDP